MYERIAYSERNTQAVIEFIGCDLPDTVVFDPRLPFVDYAGKMQLLNYGDTIVRLRDGLHRKGAQ